jgi:hypothetical protein
MLRPIMTQTTCRRNCKQSRPFSHQARVVLRAESHGALTLATKGVVRATQPHILLGLALTASLRPASNKIAVGFRSAKVESCPVPVPSIREGTGDRSVLTGCPNLSGTGLLAFLSQRSDTCPRCPGQADRRSSGRCPGQVRPRNGYTESQIPKMDTVSIVGSLEPNHPFLAVRICGDRSRTGSPGCLPAERLIASQGCP